MILPKPASYLKLYTDTIDYGTTPQNITTNGEISFTTVSGRQCIYFNNSLNNFLNFNYYNPQQFTIGYWLYVLDDNYYTAVSISSPPYYSNPYYNAVFQADLQTPNIYMIVSFPYTWIPYNIIQSISVNTWTHITYTLDQTTYTCQLFVNGNLVSTGTGNGPFPNASQFVLGKSGDNGRAFNGYMSEFFMYNSILSASQIQSIYNGQLSKPPNPPKLTYSNFSNEYFSNRILDEEKIVSNYVNKNLYKIIITFLIIIILIYISMVFMEE